MHPRFTGEERSCQGTRVCLEPPRGCDWLVIEIISFRFVDLRCGATLGDSSSMKRQSMDRYFEALSIGL